jgi:hypothetical protein
MVARGRSGKFISEICEPVSALRFGINANCLAVFQTAVSVNKYHHSTAKQTGFHKFFTGRVDC